MRDGKVHLRRTREGDDVLSHVVEVLVHPDPRCEAMHEQIREAELLQALDRVRAIYNHRTVYLLNNLVLDVTYDANLSWAELKAGGNSLDASFNRTGQTVWLTAPGEFTRVLRRHLENQGFREEDPEPQRGGGGTTSQ